MAAIAVRQDLRGLIESYPDDGRITEWLLADICAEKVIREQTSDPLSSGHGRPRPACAADACGTYSPCPKDSCRGFTTSVFIIVNPNVKLTKQLFAQAFASGATYAEMAASLGVTSRTLFKWRAQLKLPRRSRGRKAQ